MNTVNCLFELGTEELPPTSLKTLADALTSGVVAQLNAAGIETQSVTTYAASRRLAFLLENLPEKQPDREIERRGPAVQAAFKDGQPTKAAEGFARSCGTTVDQLSRLSTDKGEWLAYTLQEQGKHLSELLPEMINKSLDQLPIPKRMR
ncbi:MAG: glycine--tRNA ligase subunit beta, partial [Pseudomonadota bacterium]|nr:glycine--tRNA ligase subunit beta [Pseudomonadota bacterium]